MRMVALSTPSLGITVFDENGNLLNKGDLSTPSLGITG